MTQVEIDKLTVSEHEEYLRNLVKNYIYTIPSVDSTIEAV